MTILWINEYQNSNSFHTPYMSNSLRIQNIFFPACGVIRGPGFSTFEIFDFARGQKRAFCRMAYWELKKFILTCLEKLTWFYLLVTKDHLLGKVWGKTLFRCKMPWTALTQTESITSRFKLEVLKRIFQSRNCFQKFWSRVYCTFKEPPRRKEHVCAKHKIKKFSLKAIQYDIMTVKLAI